MPTTPIHLTLSTIEAIPQVESREAGERAELYRLTRIIHDLIDALKHNQGSPRPGHEVVTKCDLERMECRIMSAISDYTTATEARFAELGTSVDEIVASQVGIAADVASLKEIILKLQNNQGPISAEDQALLDQGVTKVTALAAKTAAASAALKELDAATASGTLPEPPPV